MTRNLRNLLLWVAIFMAFFVVAQMMIQREKIDKIGLVQLLQMGEKGKAEKTNTQIKEIVDQGGLLKGLYLDKGEEKKFETEYVGPQADSIAQWALANNVAYSVKQTTDYIGPLLLNVILPVGLFVLIWVFVMRQFQSGSSKAMSFGKSRAKLVTEGQVKVCFNDVAGIDEVKEELIEIIQFLKDPGKFSRLGGKIPKGALLYGPPGTGKTLIARAVAGEASVPFFSISGSDFVEMFVGVGASRVRDLFEQGKKAKPCLIYIDEIDAVGRHRFTGIGGGHDEREQTLNQLLVELDGFASNEGVIVMASTNRPDVLDPALLRPGRFDRQIRVDLPDLVGREKILLVHTRTLKMTDNISLKQIAKGTPGFSGADLANLANEAALLAARNDKERIEMSDFEEAKDRVMMGPERRSLCLTDKERANTAYHEAGHALVAKLIGEIDKRVHKVTIIPRGRSLGLTSILPEEDQFNQSGEQLRNSLAYLMGGRAAELLKFKQYTTGAANDLQRATELAHRMVCDFGMSEKLGPRTFGEPSSQIFVARDMVRGADRNFSEDSASLIDSEVNALVTGAYDRAKSLIEANLGFLESISQTLLERETIDGEELDRLMRGETLPPLFRENAEGERRPRGDAGRKDRPAEAAPPAFLSEAEPQPQ